MKPIDLSRLLRDEDRAEAQRLYEHEDFTDRGIGEQMIAAPLLEDRLNGGREECPEGRAVVRAAVDWQRMGCEASLTKTALRQLFVHYLAAGPSHRAATDAAFDTSLDWATRDVAGSIALLSEYLGGGDDGENHYEAFAYLPGYVDARGDPETTLVPRFAWDYAVQYVPPDDLLGIAFAAFTREEPDIAVSALERAHDSAARREVIAWAALILGEVAMRNEDLERARTLLEEAHACRIARRCAAGAGRPGRPVPTRRRDRGRAAHAGVGARVPRPTSGAAGPGQSRRAAARPGRTRPRTRTPGIRGQLGRPANRPARRREPRRTDRAAR